ncbi:hypothetical protein [Amycolatopsis solani]|uniref:hypothetical protein n=1 Tax=Amycolatopsis solani TaxID=3028615 RepID=UPI0025B144ED|nr:hypothetical protein [Amycolatopsis sp. MEP2-6]
MSTPTDHFSDAVTEITALLAAHHDGLTVLRAVTQAYGTVLEATATGVLVTDPRGGVGVLRPRTKRSGSSSSCRPRAVRARAWTASRTTPSSAAPI